MRWWRGKSRDEDLDREIRSHLELEAEEQQANGLSPEDSRYAARRALGNATQIKESIRATWRWTGFERISQDLRYASRMLRKNPGFTALAVTSLAIAIGANTAMFSILDAWLLHSLPFKDANRLTTLFRKNPHHGEPMFFPFYRDLKIWGKHSRSFEQIADAFWRGFTVTGGDDPQQVRGMIATENLFSTLGVKPVIGRTFSTGDLNGPAVAVISYGFWQERFGGRPNVLGKTLLLNQKPYEIIGVIPKNMGLRLLNQSHDPPIYALIQPGENGYSNEGTGPIAGIARLKPGVSIATANAELNAIQQHIYKHYRDEPKGGVVISSLQDDNTRTVRPSLFLTASAALFVLFMVCTNIASLLAGRAMERRRELAVRAVLGSGRGRLIQQLITENLLLALLGTALGTLVAFGSIGAFVGLNPLGILPQTPISVDWRSILFATILAFAAAGLFGWAPALEASRLKANEIIKAESRGYSGNTRGVRIRSVLVVTQIAISFALLMGCALMLRTLGRLENGPLGFRAEGASVASISVPREISKSADRRDAFYRSILQSVKGISGVTAAGITNIPPLGNAGFSSFAIEGQPTPSSVGKWPKSGKALITPGYFAALALPLLRGRTFSPYDTGESEPAVIFNEAAAHDWFGNSNPLGRRIRLHDGRVWRTVVGVVGNTASTFYNTLGWQMQPRIYIPQSQSATGGFGPIANFIWLYVRGRTPLTHNSIQAALRRVNPALSAGEFQTMTEVVTDKERQPKLRTSVLGGAAGPALLLAALGIYGVVSQSVAQRKREIGIRIAMGALSADVLHLILRQALRLAIFGIGAGAVCAFLLSRTLSSFLYGVTPTGAWVWLVPIFVLLSATVAAALIPARRASKVDPMVALRYE